MSLRLWLRCKDSNPMFHIFHLSPFLHCYMATDFCLHWMAVQVKTVVMLACRDMIVTINLPYAYIITVTALTYIATWLLPFSWCWMTVQVNVVIALIVDNFLKFCHSSFCIVEWPQTRHHLLPLNGGTGQHRCKASVQRGDQAHLPCFTDCGFPLMLNDSTTLLVLVCIAALAS